MQFIRNILILGSKTGFNQDLLFSFEDAGSKVKTEIVEDKNSISPILLDRKINSVLVNFTEAPDALYSLRLLKMYKVKTNDKLTIFFTSSNFETFQKVIGDSDLEGVNVCPWPVDENELSEKMLDSVFEKKISKQVVTEKNKKLNVDLEFIEVFINATKHTIEEMGQVSGLTHQKPTYLSQMEAPIGAGISSKILIQSEYFTGNFYVVFPTVSFLKLYENAVMEECDNINEENQDFAGELANIIYGQSKKVLSASGLILDMVIPSIHHSTQIEGETVIVIPFESSIGKFYIAVAPGTH